jgi:hypothetical protein
MFRIMVVVMALVRIKMGASVKKDMKRGTKDKP